MTTAYRPIVVKDTDYWVVKHNNVFHKVQYNSHGVPYITGKDGKYVSPVSTTGEYVLAKLDEYIYEEMEEQKPKPNQWFGF